MTQDLAQSDLILTALHPGQLRAIEERARFNVLMCGRRFGKTLLGQRLAGDTAIDGDPVGWFAPTYKYLLPVWDGMLDYLKPIIVGANKTERQIKTSTGGIIDFWTLEDEDAGRSRKYKRVIVDEAGIVRNLQKVYQQAIRPTLTDLKGDAWFLGTPKGRDFFNQCFIKGQNGEPGWKSWRFGTAQNPFMDADEVAEAKREMPPAAFEQEYLGIPAEDGANPFDIASIRRCVGRLSSGDPVVWGVDLAKSFDWCVAVALDADGNVCRLERWQSDWKSTRERLIRLIGKTRASVDSTGVGDPIVEDLQRACGNVRGFRFSSQSKQQIMEGLASAIQQEKITFPAGWLIDELESFEFEYTKTGVRYSAPVGLHDDGVCALALACNSLSRCAADWSGDDLRDLFQNDGTTDTTKQMLLQKLRGLESNVKDDDL